MYRKQSVEQLIARDEHPEWKTAAGRVADEAGETLASLAKGRIPQTVLGGLVLSGRFSADSFAEGRYPAEIAATVHMDPRIINRRGDRINDVLADLIEVGWVEPTTPQDGSIEALLAETSENPRFKLVDLSS